MDFDSNKSPMMELKKPVLKSKTPTTKSVCDMKK